MSDKKDAVGIGVTLSTQLISASLAMLAVVGTFTSYIIDKREIGPCYYCFSIGSFLCFVASVILGGKGIDRARKDGFDRNWNLINTKNYFNSQAILAFLGIILFTISLFIGKEKNDDIKIRFEKQEKAILQLWLSDSLNRVKIQNLSNEIDSLQNKLHLITSCK